MEKITGIGNIDKLFKPHDTTNKGVIAYFPNGDTVTYDSQYQCCKANGIDRKTMLRHIESGECDKNGICYDFAFERS